MVYLHLSKFIRFNQQQEPKLKMLISGLAPASGKLRLLNASRV